MVFGGNTGCQGQVWRLGFVRLLVVGVTVMSSTPSQAKVNAG